MKTSKSFVTSAIAIIFIIIVGVLVYLYAPYNTKSDQDSKKEKAIVTDKATPGTDELNTSEWLTLTDEDVSRQLQGTNFSISYPKEFTLSSPNTVVGGGLVASIPFFEAATYSNTKENDIVRAYLSFTSQLEKEKLQTPTFGNGEQKVMIGKYTGRTKKTTSEQLRYPEVATVYQLEVFDEENFAWAKLIVEDENENSRKIFDKMVELLEL